MTFCGKSGKMQVQATTKLRKALFPPSILLFFLVDLRDLAMASGCKLPTWFLTLKFLNLKQCWTKTLVINTAALNTCSWFQSWRYTVSTPYCRGTRNSIETVQAQLLILQMGSQTMSWKVQFLIEHYFANCIKLDQHFCSKLPSPSKSALTHRNSSNPPHFF